MPDPKDILYSVESGTSAQTIAKIMRVLFPDARTVIDLTYGNGNFWKDVPPHLSVYGVDIDPGKAKDACLDFTKTTPFREDAYDVAILDPPFLWDEGKSKRSIIGKRFSTYPSEEVARSTAAAGALEAWRIGRLGCIVKCSDFVHASQKVWMSHWLRDAMPVEPYDVVHQVRRSKILDQKWTGSQLSVWSNSSSFWIWRADGPVHKRREYHG